MALRRLSFDPRGRADFLWVRKEKAPAREVRPGPCSDAGNASYRGLRLVGAATPLKVIIANQDFPGCHLQRTLVLQKTVLWGS
jgi:hypothetical protein